MPELTKHLLVHSTHPTHSADVSFCRLVIVIVAFPKAKNLLGFEMRLAVSHFLKIKIIPMSISNNELFVSNRDSYDILN